MRSNKRSSPGLMTRFAREVLRTKSAPNAIAGPSRLPAVQTYCTRWLLCARQGHVATRRTLRCRFNSTNVPSKLPTSPANPLQLPAFESLITSLSSTQPCFGARGDEIGLIVSPEQFRTGLLEMIKRARRRIIISSLYIGAEEHELVSFSPSIDRTCLLEDLSSFSRLKSSKSP